MMDSGAEVLDRPTDTVDAAMTVACPRCGGRNAWDGSQPYVLCEFCTGPYAVTVEPAGQRITRRVSLDSEGEHLDRLLRRYEGWSKRAYRQVLTPQYATIAGSILAGVAWFLVFFWAEGKWWYGMLGGALGLTIVARVFYQRWQAVEDRLWAETLSAREPLEAQRQALEALTQRVAQARVHSDRSQGGEEDGQDAVPLAVQDSGREVDEPADSAQG